MGRLQLIITSVISLLLIVYISFGYYIVGGGVGYFLLILGIFLALLWSLSFLISLIIDYVKKKTKPYKEISK